MRRNAATSTLIWKTSNDNFSSNAMIKNVTSFFVLAIALCYCVSAMAQEPAKEVTTTAYPFCSTDTAVCAQVQVSYDSYQFGILLNTGDSELAPYYISSNQWGYITQKNSALAFAGVHHAMNNSSRLSWGAGLTLIGGYTSSAGYERYVGNGQFIHSSTETTGVIISDLNTDAYEARRVV